MFLSPYVAVLVVEVDDESKRPPPHGLCGDEGVLEGGLPTPGDFNAKLQRREVLDVELVILKEKHRKLEIILPFNATMLFFCIICIFNFVLSCGKYFV